MPKTNRSTAYNLRKKNSAMKAISAIFREVATERLLDTTEMARRKFSILANLQIISLKVQVNCNCL